MTDNLTGNENKRSLEDRLMADLQNVLKQCKPSDVRTLKKRIDIAIADAMVKPVTPAGWSFPDSQKILLRQKYIHVIPIVTNVLSERGISTGQILEGGSRFDFTLHGRPSFLRIGEKNDRIYVTLYFSESGEARKFSRRVGQGVPGNIRDFPALLTRIVDKGLRREWDEL